MALDLKPLTDDVIEQMGWSSHDLWLVKHQGELYGPFEVESLKHYATENEEMFEAAYATRMDVNKWQPFFSYSEFHPIAEHAHPEGKPEEVYWILNLGQKAGPFSRREIDKKMELDLLSCADLVSLDNGEKWQKFYQLDAFNSHSGSSDELPMAPLESSFQRAREEINEWMDAHEVTGSHAGLAGLAFIAQSKEKLKPNLDEMDLKSLGETEVSRSLKWAIPSAVAGVAVLAVVGNFIFSPSMEIDEVAEVKEKTQVILPKKEKEIVAKPTPVERPFNRPRVREPASYAPVERSELTRPTHSDAYPSHVVETHYNEPDPMIDPVSESDVLPPPDQTTEHSLVSNQNMNGETLDQAMGGSDNPMPEQPVIEEASDF